MSKRFRHTTATVYSYIEVRFSVLHDYSVLYIAPTIFDNIFEIKYHANYKLKSDKAVYINEAFTAKFHFARIEIYQKVKHLHTKLVRFYAVETITIDFSI